MKLPVYNIEGKHSGEIDVGEAFSKPVRVDIINRCFLSEQAALRQPYGTDPLAGQRTSAHYHGERGTRYAMMNKEMARGKRIHNQGYLNLTARFMPHAVKGRRAHPPKAESIWLQKVNKKEKLAAIISAISASSSKSFISSRGHIIPSSISHFPIIVDDKVEDVKSTKNLISFILSMGFRDELKRVEWKKIRAGRGKCRGRKYKKKLGPIIVVGKIGSILKSVNNIPGFDCVEWNKLTVSMLAPGGQPGRLAIITKSAVENLLKLGK